MGHSRWDILFLCNFSALVLNLNIYILSKYNSNTKFYSILKNVCSPVCDVEKYNIQKIFDKSGTNLAL